MNWCSFPWDTARKDRWPCGCTPDVLTEDCTPFNCIFKQGGAQEWPDRRARDGRRELGLGIQREDEN